MDDSLKSELVVKSPSLVVRKSTPPVIVVGLPRSGSSYLSHAISCLEDWFVFDDLYPYQKAASLGISSSFDLSLDREKLKRFINKLAWQLRAKIRFEENFYIPNLEWEDTFEMENELMKALDISPLTWPQVLEEWLMRLTVHCGKHRWGYKTPQDFMHMDELTDLFPGVKFIYILRDPRKVMRSFKNLPRVKTSGNQDGESRQYHPVIYSLYWKRAYENVNEFIKRDRAPVEIVKFEHLVKEPEIVSERLANFLDTRSSAKVALDKGNSSFKNSACRELTNTEVWICEKISGSYMQAAGYNLTHLTPRLSDIFDLMLTSATFGTYQFQRVVQDKRARASVTSFLKNLLKN
ncbi:MAG: sulfotransferase [Cyanobacteria bacterium P01_A01_bin.123]